MARTDRNPKPAPVKIGAKLRRARRTCRMRLKEAAELAGCTQSMPSKIETDKATPSLVLLHKIVGIVGTNIAYPFADVPPTQEIVQHPGTRPIVEVKPAQTAASAWNSWYPRRMPSTCKAISIS